MVMFTKHHIFFSKLHQNICCHERVRLKLEEKTKILQFITSKSRKSKQQINKVHLKQTPQANFEAWHK